jgi:hypothetical protein
VISSLCGLHGSRLVSADSQITVCRQASDRSVYHRSDVPACCFLLAEIDRGDRAGPHRGLLRPRRHHILEKRIAIERDKIFQRKPFSQAGWAAEEIDRFPIGLVRCDRPEAMQPPSVRADVEQEVREDGDLVRSPQLRSGRIEAAAAAEANTVVTIGAGRVEKGGAAKCERLE